MKTLTSAERKKLRGLAHHIDPVVWLGEAGITDAVIAAIDKALSDHELIKIKFVDHKDEKPDLIDVITQSTQSSWAGTIGNVAILYRENPDKEKRKIELD